MKTRFLLCCLFCIKDRKKVESTWKPQVPLIPSEKSLKSPSKKKLTNRIGRLLALESYFRSIMEKTVGVFCQFGDFYDMKEATINSIDYSSPIKPVIVILGRFLWEFSSSEPLLQTISFGPQYRAKKTWQKQASFLDRFGAHITTPLPMSHCL